MSSCCSCRLDPSEMRGVTQLNASWLREEGLRSAASSLAPTTSVFCVTDCCRERVYLIVQIPEHGDLGDHNT